LSLPQFGSIARAVAAVPEPSTLTLLAIGALGIVLIRRRP
jgi:PEP-CTERM motif